MVKASCYFCQEKKDPSYKKVKTLRKFVSDREKIYGRSKTGLCQKHQRRLAKEVKRARHLALLPFVVKTK
jgi:small subunit ribosomal protein S18